MSFIVIEGDNGTGKDTLAQALEKYGFNIITYDSEIKKFSEIAKQAKGKNRVKKFLGYGKACSDLVKQNKEKGKNSLLIRYWISTLAAAYADDIYSYDEVITIVKTISPKLEKPDKIIRLECDFDERIRRIEKRNSPDFDDKTLSSTLDLLFFSLVSPHPVKTINKIPINNKLNTFFFIFHYFLS